MGFTPCERRYSNRRSGDKPVRKIAFDIPPSDSLAVTLSHCLDTTDVIVQVYEKVETIMILKHPQVEIVDKDNGSRSPV